MEAASGRFVCAVRGGRASRVLSRAAHQALLELRRAGGRPLLPPGRADGDCPCGPRVRARGRAPYPAALAARARDLALETGFDLAGIARADAPDELRHFAAVGGQRARRRDALPHRAGREARQPCETPSPGHARWCAWACSTTPEPPTPPKRPRTAPGSAAMPGATTTTT